MPKINHLANPNQDEVEVDNYSLEKPASRGWWKLVIWAIVLGLVVMDWG